MKRSIAALRIYTQLRCDKPTKAQIEKAHATITEPPRFTGYTVVEPGTKKVDYDRKENYHFLDFRSAGKYLMEQSLRRRKIKVTPLSEAPLSLTERYAQNLTPGRYYYSRDKVPRSCRKDPYASMALSFGEESWVPSQLDIVTPGYEGRQAIKVDPNIDHTKDDIIGRITHIMELGAKDRVVAMPSAPVQLAFRPLHNRLDMITRKVFPESVVHDHARSAAIMEQHISNGNRCYCSDLSAATDRFPAEFQMGVLDAIGYTPYAEALKEVVAKDFVDSVTGQRLKYAAGQPMGLYGSFPLFNLAHACFVDRVVLEAKVLSDRPLVPFPDGSYFMVLGDDIVFSDAEVAYRYEDKAYSLGLDIQRAKGHNTPCAEFAGFLAITNNKGKTYVFRPLKYSDKGFPSVLSLLDAVGAKSLRLGSTKSKRKWWDKQYNLYRYTATSRFADLSPILVEKKDPYRVNTYRGDATNLKNALLKVYMTMPSDVPLPDFDLQTKGRVNRIPLFSERGPSDHYGYDPDKLTQAVEEELTYPLRRASKQIRTDPLMDAERSYQSEQDSPNKWRLLTSPPQPVVPPIPLTSVSATQADDEDELEF